MARFLVVGGDGLIGGAIVEFLRGRPEEVYRTTRRPVASPAALALDLSDPDCSIERAPGIERVLDGAPLVVFLAAAVSGYAQCEADPVATRRVNVDNPIRIAGKALRRGAFVVFPSSTAVFSGVLPAPSEADATDPVSEYGRQKADAEAQLRRLSASAVEGGGIAIVRLTKVLSRRSPLIASWIEALRAGRSIEAARDLRVAPISLAYAVRNLTSIGASRRAGTFHLSGAQEMAYVDFAMLLAARLGAGDDRVVPVAVGQRLDGSGLPQVGVLDMNWTAQHAGIEPQRAAQVVEDLLEEEACGDGESPHRNG